MYERLLTLFPGEIYIVFILGFFLLIKGADWLVDGSSAIAKRLNISDIVIGLTIVSFGTSAPELVVNIIASFDGKPDIAIGNILGSNVANILLILGIASLIYPLSVNKNTIWKEIPLSILAALMVGVLVNDIFLGQGNITILSRSDGLVLLAFFIIFLYYTVGIAKESGEHLEGEIEKMSMHKAALLTVVGLIMLPLGGDWIVRGAVHTARVFGMSESVISLTIIAIGTSLPEVAASAVAALKRKTDIAIGNAVGSNIFNIFWVLGLSSLIRPIPFQIQSNRDILAAAAASCLLFICLFIGKKRLLQRWQGGAFLVLYAGYLIYLVFFAPK